MSPCAPTIVLLTLDEMLEPFADGLCRLFGTTALHEAGYRLWHMDASGNGQGSLAAIRDAAAFVLLRQAVSAPRRRSLIENAVIQHLAAAGRRQTLPVLEVLFQAQQGLTPSEADSKLSQNPHFRRLILPGHNRHLPTIIEAMGVALASQTGPLPHADGGSQLLVAGVALDEIDEATDHPHWPELALMFGCCRDLADDPRFADIPAAAATRWQQALALRNLAIGNRQGAIRHLRELLLLDDGHFIANFWLSRLLADSSDSAELELALHHGHVARGHLDRQMPLVHSLLLTHQARTNHALGRVDAALAQARDAALVHINEESVVALVREVLAKLRRDGDIRLYHNEALVNETVLALQGLFANSPQTYYRVMRQLDADHAGELLSQLAQRLTLALQKVAVPVFRGEQEITLFAGDCCRQPLLASREAKPLSPWQQLDQCRESLANQLVMLQQCGQHLQAEEQELNALECQLRERLEWVRTLPEETEEAHQQLGQALHLSRRHRSTALLIFLLSALALAVGLTTLPLLRPYLGWLLAAAFVLAVAYVGSWRKQRERAQQQRELLHATITRLEQTLGEEQPPLGDAHAIAQRSDFLLSRLREETEQLARLINHKRERLIAQAQLFIPLCDRFEEALRTLDGRFYPPQLDEQGLGWAILREPQQRSPLPPSLRRRVRAVTRDEEQFLALDLGQGPQRHACYFSGCSDAERWQRQLSLLAPATVVAATIDDSSTFENVVSLHQEVSNGDLPGNS